MSYIIAIGGGDNGWGNSKYETQKVDEIIVNRTNKNNPNFLFIGFAAQKPEDYYQVICNIFGKYGCAFSHLTQEICNQGLAEELISKADIIYVGGGNTYKLMRRIRKYGLDIILKKTYFSRDIVLCGVSAGAICWCNYGNSATRYTKEGICAPIKVKGIGIVNVLYCPHCTRDSFRSESMKAMMKKIPKLVGVEVDYAAIEIKNEFFRIINLDERAIVKKCYWHNGKYHYRYLNNQEYLPLKELCEYDRKEVEN